MNEIEEEDSIKNKKKKTIRCMEIDSECAKENCQKNKTVECTGVLNSHCYAFTKQLKDNTIIYIKAGCWAGGDECEPPISLYKKLESKNKANLDSNAFDLTEKTERSSNVFKIPDDLLVESIQKSCISYSTNHNYLSINNNKFCCCSDSLCNQHVVYTTHSNPFEVYALSRNPVRTTTKPNQTLNSQHLTAIIFFSILISVAISSLILFLLYKNKLIFKKSKFNNLPRIFFRKEISQPNDLVVDTSLNPNGLHTQPNDNQQHQQNHQQNKQIILNEYLKSSTLSTQEISKLAEPLLLVHPSLMHQSQLSQASSSQRNQIITNNEIDQLPFFVPTGDLLKSSHILPLNFASNDNFQDFASEKYFSSSLTSEHTSTLPAKLKSSDLQLLEKVSIGQFSSVWKASCLNAPSGPFYAVKVFASFQKNAWQNERDIYHHIHNENILTYFSSDMFTPKDQQSSPFLTNEYWLITEYHSEGSLYDFLKLNLLSWSQMIKFCYSILDGLAYLHNEYVDSRKPYAIAHRDLKSKNILVKQGGQACCIADFGLALKLNNSNKLQSSEIRSKVGTRRYMSPELLEGAISFTKESFIRKMN
jgi:hypothetical protein